MFNYDYVIKVINLSLCFDNSVPRGDWSFDNAMFNLA